MRTATVTLVCLMAAALFLASSSSPFEMDAAVQRPGGSHMLPGEDMVTVEITDFRALEPDIPSALSVTVDVNGETVSSPMLDGPYCYDIGWRVSVEVPATLTEVPVTLQLWAHGAGGDVRCDIGGVDAAVLSGRSASLLFNRSTGDWTGDDYRGDPSGYGRLNGCDDGSIYTAERDCELWFSITGGDADGDGLTDWEEVNVYGTDPEMSNEGEDADGDGIPIEWEDRWGYDPFKPESHATLDPDNDGLSNLEEYRMRDWQADPYRRDLYVELDQMELRLGNKIGYVSADAKEMLKTVYNRRSIVYHLDDGCMGGGEIIPFDALTGPGELTDIYRQYFLHNDSNAWRRGVFHYGVVINRHFLVDGHAFPGDGSIFDFDEGGVNCFQISRQPLAGKILRSTQEKIDFYHACLIMHETGHTLGIYAGHPLGCDNQFSKYPWQLGSYIFRNYRSVMNYRYTYHLLDYSDGTHGPRDYDDWGNLDLTFFEP
ncbi:MAG: hypothetical protein R6U10_00315 [Thermoplasmatota archaeon]